MPVALPTPTPTPARPEPPPARRPEPLESGDQLHAREFLRRYEAMPHVRKAELVEGIVYMPSPVRFTQHAKPDGLIHTWLGTYEAKTPGTEFAPNATVHLDADNVPQPDALLRLRPEAGGRTTVNADGYLAGPPELIVEIAASSVSIDVRDKLRAYRRAGVREYLIWRTLDGQFDWLLLEGDEYRPLQPDAQHLLRSQIFPGLWLDVEALLDLNPAKVLDGLQTGLQSPEHAAFVARLKAGHRI